MTYFSQIETMASPVLPAGRCLASCQCDDSDASIPQQHHDMGEQNSTAMDEEKEQKPHPTPTTSSTPSTIEAATSRGWNNIRYAGIEPFDFGGRHWSLGRAYWQQLFHMRPFRSFVLSLKIPDAPRNRRIKSRDATLELQRMFQFLQTASYLPTVQECENIHGGDNEQQLSSPNIGIPMMIRSMMMVLHHNPNNQNSWWCFKPNERIYAMHPIGCVWSVIWARLRQEQQQARKPQLAAKKVQSSGHTDEIDEAEDEEMRAFYDLCVIPNCHGFKCFDCSKITKEMHGDISIQVAHGYHVKEFIKELIAVPGGHWSETPLQCANCSKIQPNRWVRVLFRAHLFPRVLIVRFQEKQDEQQQTTMEGDGENDKKNKFDKVLDLTPYCIPGRERRMRYQLSGFVVHDTLIDPPDSSASSHIIHTSYIRERYGPAADDVRQINDEDCVWLKFDHGHDEEVTRVDEDEVMEYANGRGRGTAILLFYEREEEEEDVAAATSTVVKYAYKLPARHLQIFTDIHLCPTTASNQHRNED